MPIGVGSLWHRPLAQFGVSAENQHHQGSTRRRPHAQTHTSPYVRQDCVGETDPGQSLAEESSTILLSEDNWLLRLYPDQIQSVSDYVRFAHQIREIVGPLVTDMLSAGVNVVLDFPANTPNDRQWLSGLADVAEAAHCVHYLETADDVCRSRLHLRNSCGEHEFAATDAELDLMTSFFRAPHVTEGLEIKTHRCEDR